MKNKLIIILACLFSCSPYVFQKDTVKTMPVFSGGQAVMADGYRLPLLQLETEVIDPKAIVLALHGMNDYSNSFRGLGEYLALRNIQMIAYDQRGFGQTQGRGYWHGIDSLTADLKTMCRLIEQKYPGIPLFLLGNSMGGAVVLSAFKSLDGNVKYHGVILIAPAVWAKDTMPWYQRYALMFFAHTLPWLIVSADGLDITPSDNTQMLKKLGKDSLVIHETRTDALYGMSNLMDRALVSSANAAAPTLLLYGENDEIIPREPVCRLLKTLRKNKNLQWRFILYPDGYHMLVRDLQAERVYRDIEKWIIETGNGNNKEDKGVQAKDLKWVCGS